MKRRRNRLALAISLVLAYPEAVDGPLQLDGWRQWSAWTGEGRLA